MNILRPIRPSWALPLGLVAGLACAGNPAPPAADPAPTEPAEAEAPAPAAPAAPSIDPAPDPFPPGALPEPGVEVRDPATRTVDVTRYELDIDLRGLADSVMTGRATLSLVPPLGEDHFDLDFVGLRVDSVRIDGVRAAFLQEPAVLRVVANEGFDEELDLDVFYHGTPRDGLFIGPDPAGDLTAFADNWPNRARWWFPANDHPPDKATAGFTVRVPPGYAVVANGRLVESSDFVWRWRTDVEIPAYTMVIGVARFETAELGPAACGRAAAVVEGDCAPVSTWALAGGGEYGERRFARAPDMVDFYTEMFGPYPYEKLAHVQSSTRFGGMENSSAIFYAMGGWAEEEMGEGVIAHETVHQWFGDDVTPASWAHLWVSEGFATYFAAVYFEMRDGPEALRESMEGGRRAVIGSDASNRPVVDERNDLFGLLNTNSYPKGAWILHMLRSMLGDDAFFAAIRNYYADNRERGFADSEDVRRAMEEAYGEDLGWFFEQWAYSPGFPKLRVSSRVADGAAIVTIEQVQPGGWPTFRLPLDVELRDAQGRTTLREIDMQGRREILRVPWSAGVPEVRLDPGGELLMEVATE